MQESVIFKAAVKLPAGERAAYLDKACGVNAALRLEIEALLRAHEQPGQFMERPPIADMATDYRPGPERPGTRIGPYKLLQYLGEGGMGTVFLAEQSQPVRRMVALKIIKLGMDSSQILARFEAERQALAIMDHPNIAKVFDAGTTQVGLELPLRPANGTNAEGKDDAPKEATEKNNGDIIPLGRPYFVMELVKGVPITEFCDKNKLTTRQRLELFVPVCHAIQHAHMKGIIHRDIKPSNVLIALYDGKPVPKVIDFGVAKAMSEPLTQRTMFTQIGQIVGTFEYMSPEQATLNQLDIDTRSDIYSLGVLLYELLTGMTPLNKDKLRTLALDQMLRTIREEEPVRPSVKLSSEAGALATAAAYRGVPSSRLTGVLRGELDWIVMKCLEKERDRRFVTAGSLAQDIERYLRDEPVTACPPSLAYRARKAYRKNRLAIITGSIVAAALLVATAISIVFAVTATQARRQAEEAESAIAIERDNAIKAGEETAKERDKNVAMVERLRQAQNEQRHNQYAWDMQIMPTAWDSGRIGQVQQLLDRHAENLRAFEWHYWNRQIHNERRHLTFKSTYVMAMRDTGFAGLGGLANSSSWVMNDLGTRVACVSYDLTARRTDPETKTVTSTRTYFLEVYDTVDGQRLCRHQLFAETDNGLVSLQGLVLSTDGTRAAIGWSKTIFNRQGERTVSNSSSRQIRVLDVATGNTLYDLNLKNDNDGRILMQAPFFFCADGRLLAVNLTETMNQFRPPGSVTQVDTPTGQARLIDLQAQPVREVCCIETTNTRGFGPRGSNFAFSPDGARAAHIKWKEADGVTTGTLTLVDTNNGKEIHTVPLTGQLDYPALTFSPDGRRLALASLSIVRRDQPPNQFRMSLSMIEPSTGKELYKETEDLGEQMPGGPFVRPIFSPDGATLYLRNGGQGFLGGSGRVWAFHAETGKPLAGFDHDFVLGKHCFSPDGKRLIHTDANALVVRDALTGRVLNTLRGHVQNINYLAMSSDGRALSSLDSVGEFKVWNTYPAAPLVLRGLTTNTARLSPDGHYVAATIPSPTPGANDNANNIVQLALWDTTTGGTQSLALRPAPALPSEGEKAEGLYSSNVLNFTSNSRYVCLVRTSTYRVKNPPESTTAATGVEKTDPQRAGPPYRTFAMSDLTVWDSVGGQETAYLKLSGENSSTSDSYAISPDGKSVFIYSFSASGASSGRRLSVTALDLATGSKLWSKEADSAVVTTPLSLSPDGRILLVFQRNLPRNPSGEPVPASPATMQCQVLEAATGNLIRSFEVPFVGSLTPIWCPDCKLIALITSRSPRMSTQLRVVNIETGEPLMSLDSPPGRIVNYLNPVFSPDGRRLAARQRDMSNMAAAGFSTLKIWDTSTGNELLALPAEREFGNLPRLLASQLAFTPDGHRIVEFTPGRTIPGRGDGARTPPDSGNATVRFVDATPLSGK